MSRPREGAVFFMCSECFEEKTTPSRSRLVGEGFCWSDAVGVFAAAEAEVGEELEEEEANQKA